MRKILFIILLISIKVFSISIDNIYNDALAKRLALNKLPVLAEETDEVELVYCLELVKKIGNIISQETGFVVSNGYDQKTMYHMVSLFFRSYSKKDLCDELCVLSGGSEQSIEKVYNLVKDLLCSTQGVIAEVKERIKTQHSYHDTYERAMCPHPCRSLSKVLSNGIQLSIQPHYKNKIKKRKKSNHCTILEAIKNKKWATINEFSESKVVLMVHDSFDHMYVYHQAKQNGILDRYALFLERIGNPHIVDIFNRPGEFLASVGFEFRFFHLNKTPEPLFSFNEIIQWFSEPAHDLSKNQHRVYKILFNAIDPEFKNGVAMVISNVLIELMEQRRKFGFIQDLYEKKSLRTFDLELIAFLIESYHMLYLEKEAALQTLYAIYCMVEEYLENIDSCADAFIITLDAIKLFSEEHCKLSREKLDYIKNNLGNLSHRKVYCN